MFYSVVLGLLAILGLGCCGDYFYFNEVYTVTAEYLNSPWTMRVWYDAVYEQSRIDVNKGSLQLAFLRPSNGHPYGRVKEIFPITTETHLNMKQCTIYEGSRRRPTFLESILPNRAYFQEVGHEIIRGENATKFYYPETIVDEDEDEIAIEAGWYFWTARKILHGQLEYVPLQLTILVHDFDRGIYTYNTAIYSDYDTAPINNEVFMIDYGLTCGHRNINESDRVLNELSNLPFPGTMLKLKTQNQPWNKDMLKLRQDIVKRNRKMIEEHNRGDHSYTMAANHLIDRTDEEIVMMCGRLPTNGPSKGQPFPYSDAEIEALSAELPETFDWRMYGAVTSIKDQGECGSCWAFGAIGAVEGALFLKNKRKRLVNLSEQALIDCSWGFNNQGCNGGYEVGAFEYMMKHGVANSDQYGKYQEMSSFCHMEKTPVEATIQAFYNITQSEKALKVALIKHGPLTVAINVCRPLIFYEGGVFDSPYCQGPLNHAVTLVGYGVLDGKRHWILKNSWGEGWAAGGYLLVAIEGNVCRVQDDAFFVTLK